MVKFTIFILFVFVLIMPNTIFAQKDISSIDKEIEFVTTIHDFGEIKYGGNGTYEFIFFNTGLESVIIKNVTSTCGCTVPAWKQKPITPGQKSSITVKYDTKRVGRFIKNTKVYTSISKTPYNLQIQGEVLPKGK